MRGIEEGVPGRGSTVTVLVRPYFRESASLYGQA